MGAGEKEFDVDECFKALPHKFPHRTTLSTVLDLAMMFFCALMAMSSLFRESDKTTAGAFMGFGIILLVFSTVGMGIVQWVLYFEHRRRVLDWILRERCSSPPVSVLTDYAETKSNLSDLFASNPGMAVSCAFSLLCLGGTFLNDPVGAFIGLLMALLGFMFHCIFLHLHRIADMRDIIFEAIALHHTVDLSRKTMVVGTDGKKHIGYKTRK